MRLHRLEVTAFGPYRQTERVDFDALGADGLFLLHGDTGAGKTSLLDAVAFALFGTVPGARGQVKRLRCDLAEPETVTTVALELTVQGHRLRIVRSPEYQRPKRRGAGTTTQQAKAVLAWLSSPPDGEPAEGITRIDEVSRTVQRLLGMSAEQFFQVVLLPQGEFARFLRADTAEREQLLERLFGTRRFADVERWFREHRTLRWRALEQLRQGVRQWLARIAQVAGVDEPPEEAGKDWAAELGARARREAAEAVERERLARAAQQHADMVLQDRRTMSDRVRRVRAAHASLTALAGEAEKRELWAAEIGEARRAAAVAEVVTAYERYQERLVTARRAEEEQLARVPAGARSGLARSVAEATVADLRAAAGRFREEAGLLTGLLAEAEQQRLDRARTSELAAKATTATERAGALAEELASLPERTRKLREELDLAAQAQARLEGVTAKETELAAALRDARELVTVERSVAEAADNLRQAVDSHQDARAALLDLRERRLAGMAAELAADLHDGESCPVCGATEHPAPATGSGHQIGKQDEDAAAALEQRAARHRDEAQAAWQRAEARLTALRDRLADRTEEDLVGHLGEVRAELVELTGRAAGHAKLRDAVRKAEQEAERLAGLKAERETIAAAAEAERAALADQVAERERRLDTARDGHPDVATRRTKLLESLEALEALAEARASRQSIEERLAEQRAAVDKAVRDAGFESTEDARAAVRDETRLTELETILAEADAAEAAARAVLAEPELCDVSPDLVVDVDGAAQAAEEKRRQLESAVAAARVAERTAAELAKLRESLARAARELEPAEAEYAELDALTDVVNGRGQNVRKMSLRSYVLAARLEEVAVAATARLRVMSEGRYSFVHSEAAGARGTRGGLGLDVLDDYSGAIRPAKTLSGGESFLASLALALGLADVVAAETGGALLDTLFVDEGFGTLDAETLDTVMNVLDELRAGGRVVGLVSHVEELRQRIPVRLLVRKARTGSTVELRT